MTTGEQEIATDEARIVERIFREFVAGVSPKQIAKNLNREGIAGPFGGAMESEHPLRQPPARRRNSKQRDALEHSETRTEATEALRGLIDAIVLTPD